MTYDLFQSEIQSSPLFVPLAKFSLVKFKGFLDENVQRYECERENEICTLLGATVIRRDEKFAWEASEELLERAVKDAAVNMRGVYRYDLLSFDVHREIETFNFQDLTQLIVNHSRKLSDGQEQLIKYCSQYGLLRKLSETDWGKVSFQGHVMVFDKDPVQLDLLIAKFLRKAVSCPRPLMIVLNDQSLHPIFDRKNAEQIQRLTKFFQKEFAEAPDIPEIFVHDKSGTTELVSEFYQG